jgi:hypothetical protein
MSRMADKVPDAFVVPRLAPHWRRATRVRSIYGRVSGRYWTMIDGERNLREISSDTWRKRVRSCETVYGMTCTGLLVAGAPLEAMANG